MVGEYTWPGPSPIPCINNPIPNTLTSVPKMEAVQSSKTLVPTYKSTTQKTQQSHLYMSMYAQESSPTNPNNTLK